MKTRSLRAAAAISLACLSLAGCVSEGGSYSDYRYVDRYDGPYWRDHDRWDRPNRPHHGHRPGRPDHDQGRPDRDQDSHTWRNSERNGLGHPDRGGAERNGLGHPEGAGPGRILPGD